MAQKGVYIKKDVSFRTIYEDNVNRGFSNFSSNNPDAQFDPKTGNMLINASVALNNGLVTGGVQVEQIYEREDGIKRFMIHPILMLMKRVMLTFQMSILLKKWWI